MRYGHINVKTYTTDSKDFPKTSIKKFCVVVDIALVEEASPHKYGNGPSDNISFYPLKKLRPTRQKIIMIATTMRYGQMSSKR
jgi:hypothetical protein